MCVCVRVCVCVCVNMCVYVCVRGREDVHLCVSDLYIPHNQLHINRMCGLEQKYIARCHRTH